MAAKIYAVPEELGDPPVIDFANRDRKRSIDELMEPERAWERQVAEWCRENGNGDLAGEEVSWQRGDGYARYVVYTEKPLALIHLPTGDAWQIEEIMVRGLRLSDIREEVRRRKALNDLFSRRSS